MQPEITLFNILWGGSQKLYNFCDMESKSENIRNNSIIHSHVKVKYVVHMSELDIFFQLLILILYNLKKLFKLTM